jgi:hypothetical protein
MITKRTSQQVVDGFDAARGERISVRLPKVEDRSQSLWYQLKKKTILIK